jgi:hypothetical protein
MHGSWKIDDANTIKVYRHFLGKHRILHNDKEIASKTPFGKTLVPFNLPDGRKGELAIIPSGFVAELELRIEGRVVLSDADSKSISCLQCGISANPVDKFCAKCGAELPTAENQLKIKKLKEARKVILIVAIFFLLTGVIIFFVQNHASVESLKNLSRFQDSDIYPQLVAGKKYTVGEIRHELQRQPWLTLWTNVFLAIVMFGLFHYAKKSPLVAIFIAAGIYLAVQVVNGILDPRMISQGLIVKFIVISILIKGIRSTLELRKISG